MATESQILSSFSPRACPRCMLTSFSAGDTTSALYICREPSTNQLLFMQNKPNVKDAQINVNSYMKSKYEKLDTWLSGKNKDNSNPIKPNFQKAKMNVNLTLTRDYRKKDDFVVRKNKPNFQNGLNERKLNFNKGLQKKRLFSTPKNKPKQTQFTKGQNEHKIACQKIWPHPVGMVTRNNLEFSR